MSDCRTIQAMDMLLTQEWTVTGAGALGQLAPSGTCSRAVVLTGTCKSQGEIIYIYMDLHFCIYTLREGIYVHTTRRICECICKQSTVSFQHVTQFILSVYLQSVACAPALASR